MKKNEKDTSREPEENSRGSYVKAELLDTIKSLVNLGYIYAWSIPAYFDYVSQSFR